MTIIDKANSSRFSEAGFNLVFIQKHNLFTEILTTHEK